MVNCGAQDIGVIFRMQSVALLHGVSVREGRTAGWWCEIRRGSPLTQRPAGWLRDVDM